MTCASVEDHMTQGSSRCTVTYHRASAGRETLPTRSGRGGRAARSSVAKSGNGEVRSGHEGMKFFS